jgi:predicted enzyme related to lactoylglutathione lyase
MDRRAQAPANRGHVDGYAEGDVEEEIARLERLGATRSDIGQTGDEGFTVLADPEGNEFCVLDRTWRSQEG